ncbi:HAD family hydrolase [Kutzneria sp. NPDC052558]|uniref:HAD family hydrolase n=1 Tax=Kutzneria sp. NPDC052558 TaxID=3364121 RepID=UPI0037C6DDA5
MSDFRQGMAIWTDFGGVLTPPVAETFRSFSDRFGVPEHALKEAMKEVGRSYGTDSMGPLDIPLVDEQTWAKQVEDVLSEQYGVIADLSDFGENWFHGRPANRAWVAYLRTARQRGVFVGMLSNMPPAWEPQWRRMVSEDLFDAVVVSHDSGCRKPEQAIYELAARRAGRQPHECVLVDDLAVNCEGARAAGWNAVLFTDTAKAAEEIEDLLALAPVE